jgi:IS5 family transposase
MATHRSRVYPSHKTCYRVTNWPKYDRGLVERGCLTFWIAPETLEAWRPAPSGRRGGQRRYSDVAILTAHTLRLRFGLTLRETEGFVRSIFALLGLEIEVPDHTTLSRRLRELEIPLEAKTGKGPLHLVLDSTGLSIFGDGEWARAKHGDRGVKRGWRKLHLGVSDSGEIVAQVVTDASVDDAFVGRQIIAHVPGSLTTVTGDAAYDTHEVYAAARSRQARVVVPPIASATPDRRGVPRSPERDATVRRVAAVGLREWKRRSGYGRQGAAENAFFRFKTIVGPALRARDEDNRQAEARLGCVILNRMRELA